MKAPLPRGAWITLYRTTATGKVGAYLNLAGSAGFAAYERLVADPAVIEAEFADAGLPPPHPSASEFVLLPATLPTASDWRR